MSNELITEEERQRREERLARLASRRATTSPRPTSAWAAPAGEPLSLPVARRRRHAAGGSRAAALVLSVTTTVGLAGYLRATESSANADAAALDTTTPSSRASSGASTSSGLADGTFTGDTATNRWGPVQVQITVSGGEITAVDVLQTPDSKSKSVAINDRAVPILVDETIAAQNADVDAVSGATYTSKSYRESLQSALDQATVAAATS